MSVTNRLVPASLTAVPTPWFHALMLPDACGEPPTTMMRNRAWCPKARTLGGGGWGGNVVLFWAGRGGGCWAGSIEGRAGAHVLRPREPWPIIGSRQKYEL